MDGESIFIYLRVKRRVRIVKNQIITVNDIASILTDTQPLESKIRNLVIYRHREQDGNRVVIDLLQVIKRIKGLEPTAQIEIYGEPHILLTIAEPRRAPHFAMLILCWLLLFFGSGIALMNFHQDVNMKETQIRIVELLTGDKLEHPLWFQIPYSIGIGAGMVLFFNHLFKKKFNEEPNPLEVELFMYEENVNNYVIADELHKQDDRSSAVIRLKEIVDD